MRVELEFFKLITTFEQIHDEKNNIYSLVVALTCERVVNNVYKRYT